VSLFVEASRSGEFTNEVQILYQGIESHGVKL
jgi:hypothetical protein